MLILTLAWPETRYGLGLLAARNLRGLLQVGLLQRLDLDQGTRYAIVTIASYIALGAGLVGGLAEAGIAIPFPQTDVHMHLPVGTGRVDLGGGERGDERRAA